MRFHVALLLLGLSTPPLPAAERGAIEVRPGSVVRWPGEGIVECSQAGRRFAPIAGACLFPIDLLAEGELAVSRRTAAGEATRRLKIADYPYPTERITGVEEKYVSPPAGELARIEREQQDVAALFRRVGPRRFALPLGGPLAVLPEGGRFGARRIFNGEPRSPHGGTDFRAASGTPVLAPADGVVALAAEHYFAGRAVYLDHGDGLISMAFHLSAILVRDGEAVERGQTIGRVGATGRVTGPHLHFALRWRGERIEPALLLASPESLPAIE